MFKSESVRRSFAEGAAITECTVGVIFRAGEQLVKSFTEWHRVLRVRLNSEFSSAFDSGHKMEFRPWCRLFPFCGPAGAEELVNVQQRTLPPLGSLPQGGSGWEGRRGEGGLGEGC